MPERLFPVQVRSQGAAGVVSLLHPRLSPWVATTYLCQMVGFVKLIPTQSNRSGYVAVCGSTFTMRAQQLTAFVPQVDTRAKPPRSIWVHPYEDEQFLREHPDIRDRLARERPSDVPPPYSSRRHSYSGSPSGSHLNVPERSDAMRTSISQPGTPGVPQQNRGFFGKLKDKAIGTKEEREARRREERRREEEVSIRISASVDD